MTVIWIDWIDLWSHLKDPSFIWGRVMIPYGCLPQMDEGSFKWLQRYLWQAVPGCHGSSQWFKWHTLRLSCLNMTSYSQLTIANSGTSCLPPLDDGSFKCIQRCSWRLFQGAMTALNGWNDMPWCCLALIWHPILSWQLPTLAQAFFPH